MQNDVYIYFIDYADALVKVHKEKATGTAG